MDRRLQQLERWLKAVVQHEPGATDAAATTVSSWSADELKSLWIDLNVTLQLIQNPRRSSFVVTTGGQSPGEAIHYSSAQLDRLRALACAADGAIGDGYCAAGEDADLLLLSTLAANARACGDNNYVIRRGALLHSDVAMLIPEGSEPVVQGASLRTPGPERVRVSVDDGTTRFFDRVAAHWEIGRMLLDHVTPRRGVPPDPSHDPMVRAWYVATGAWMQNRQEYDDAHLLRARLLFPTDADVLFLTGTLHETYASPAIQWAMSSARSQPGLRFSVGSERTELREAERLFRQALIARPPFAEAHLRLGRVLFLLGQRAEAVAELRSALSQPEDMLLQYYAQLFLGSAHESLGAVDAAREAYAAASELEPEAQSPRLALSTLALRFGYGGPAIQSPVFASISTTDSEPYDPWWIYHIAQGRHANELLDALRESVLSGGCP
jgi:hypothetical protein